jgi:hypothetical protein
MKRIESRLFTWIAAAALFAGTTQPLAAQDVNSPSPAVVTYNFDQDTLGQQTEFSNSVNGLTATFRSPADPGGFGIGSSFFAPPMSGNVLLDPGASGADFIPLTITFSKKVDSIYLFFATDGTGTFELTAYYNSMQVGTASATGVIPPGYGFPQGVISLSGVTFTSVTLSSPSTPYFAIDNVTVTLASDLPQVRPAPESWSAAAASESRKAAEEHSRR